MNEDQSVQLGFGALVAVAYGGRLAVVGNGAVKLFSYQINPFALTLLVLLVLAVPETLDRLPFGPTRKK